MICWRLLSIALVESTSLRSRRSVVDSLGFGGGIMLGRLLLCVVAVVGLGLRVEADDLAAMVQKAIAEERKEFEALNERFTKNKLKPQESIQLFGKKAASTPRKEKLATIEELGKKVAAGEVSFRRFSLDGPKIGEWGCLPYQIESGNAEHHAVKVQQVVNKSSFMGVAWGAHKGGDLGIVVEAWSQPMIFKGVANDPVDGDFVALTMPLIVTGRETYQTVGAGLKTTVVVESLAECLKRVSKKTD